MKQSVPLFSITATILLICLFPFQVSAQVRIIDKPHYRFKNTGIETISKIELHDTITKVHMHVTFLPNWWIEFYPTDFIKPVNSDKRYHLLGIENGVMNKQLSTPSGEAHYVLLFPPLDKSVKEIHYGDMKNNQEVIAIFHISLEKSFDSLQYARDREITATIAKRLKDEIKKGELAQPIDFDSDSFFNSAPSRLVGFIKGYWSDTIQTHPIYTRGLSGELHIFPLKLYPDGYFEADIKIEYPKMLSFSLLRSGEVSFYIEPGHTLSMILDWEDVLEGDRYRDRRYIFTKTEFAGTLAEVNRDLLKRTIFKPNGYEIDQRMKSMSPTEHRKDLESRINANLEALRETEAGSSLCPKAKRLIENEIKMDALEELLRFSMHYLQRENENNTVPLTTDYYSPLKLLPDDRSLLPALSFDRMLASLNNAGIFFRPWNIHLPEFNPEQSFKDYLIAEGKMLSDEALRLMPLIQSTLEISDGRISEALKTELKENSTAIQQLLQNHINEFMAYRNKYTKQDPIGEYKINMQKRDEIISDSLGINGILKDVFLFHNHCAWLLAHENLQSDDLNNMTERCIARLSSPFLRKRLSELSFLTAGSLCPDFRGKTITAKPFTLSSLLSKKKTGNS